MENAQVPNHIERFKYVFLFWRNINITKSDVAINRVNENDHQEWVVELLPFNGEKVIRDLSSPPWQTVLLLCPEYKYGRIIKYLILP